MLIYNTEYKVITSLIFCLMMCLPIQNTSAQQQSVSWEEAQNQNINWYGSKEATRIANNVLIYQNNNGGWFKNIDMANQLSNAEKQRLLNKKNKKLGTTIDKKATFTQLRFLAKVYNKTEKKEYKQAFDIGLDYLLKAQYENGGWPQFYPLKGGYYDHITFNDNAMMGVMFLLKDIVNQEKFDFVEVDKKDEIKKALKKAENLILKLQIRIDGKPTLWCAQHQSTDLSPAKARSYELPSLSGAESVGIVRYLMTIENPTEEIKESIKSAISWFEKHEITGYKVKQIKAPNLPEDRDRIVVEDENASPLWGRFNEIGTGQVIFVGRDGIPKSKLSQIEHERRIGYSYLGNYAEDLLNRDYHNWLKRITK